MNEAQPQPIAQNADKLLHPLARGKNKVPKDATLIPWKAP